MHIMFVEIREGTVESIGGQAEKGWLVVIDGVALRATTEKPTDAEVKKLLRAKEQEYRQPVKQEQK